MVLFLPPPPDSPEDLGLSLTNLSKSSCCSSTSSGIFSKCSEESNCSNDSSLLLCTQVLCSSSGSSTCGSSSRSTASSTASTPTKKSDRLLAKTSGGKGMKEEEGSCLWRDCACIMDPISALLDHIQAIHVAPQTKAEGYCCLWKGCKVYNKKSSSLSWIERHVLTHGGNKPFRCIFPGCGLSFGSQGALERHVNSHMTTCGTTATNGHSVARKLDSSPSKASKRKKLRGRKQKLNTGQFVDFFDKRTIEVIKYRLSRAVQIEETNSHNCTFTCQVLSKRISPHEEPHLLVRWFPMYILPDEWIPQSKFEDSKTIPFRQLPPERLQMIFPHMFPPERKEKAKRKWKPPPPSSSSSPTSSTPAHKKKGAKIEFEALCECCCNSKKHCRCIPLDSDWVEFISPTYWL